METLRVPHEKNQIYARKVRVTTKFVHQDPKVSGCLKKGLKGMPIPADCVIHFTCRLQNSV